MPITKHVQLHSISYTLVSHEVSALSAAEILRTHLPDVSAGSAVDFGRGRWRKNRTRRSGTGAQGQTSTRTNSFEKKYVASRHVNRSDEGTLLLLIQSGVQEVYYGSLQFAMPDLFFSFEATTVLFFCVLFLVLRRFGETSTLLGGPENATPER